MGIEIPDIFKAMNWYKIYSMKDKAPGGRRFKSCLRKRKRDTRENLVSFFMPCDRRVPGAAAPTAAGGRRRKVMQARNREFRRQNAERESGRPDFEVGKAGSNPVSASEKGIQEKNLVS